MIEKKIYSVEELLVETYQKAANDLYEQNQKMALMLEEALDVIEDLKQQLHEKSS